MLFDTPNWGGYSSGSDDGAPAQPTVTANKQESSTRLYPIKYQGHKSPYAKVLYDVEGNPLKSDRDVYLSVHRKEMKEAFDSNQLRFIHYMSSEPNYRYFVTSESQLQNFQKHRDHGAPSNKVYHVYLDEDANLHSPFYRRHFLDAAN
jgi:hypothetical protein